MVNFDCGVYVLEMHLAEPVRLEIGRLGCHELRPGYYYYVGSAQRNLKSRIFRHLRSEKKLRWHIDFLSQHIKIIQVYIWPGAKELECQLGVNLQKFPAVQVPIRGFGASDCKCVSHLFYFSYRPNLANLLHVVQLETGLVGEPVL